MVKISIIKRVRENVDTVYYDVSTGSTLIDVIPTAIIKNKVGGPVTMFSSSYYAPGWTSSGGIARYTYSGSQVMHKIEFYRNNDNTEGVIILPYYIDMYCAEIACREVADVLYNINIVKLRLMDFPQKIVDDFEGGTSGWSGCSPTSEIKWSGSGACMMPYSNSQTSEDRCITKTVTLPNTNEVYLRFLANLKIENNDTYEFYAYIDYIYVKIDNDIVFRRNYVLHGTYASPNSSSSPRQWLAYVIPLHSYRGKTVKIDICFGVRSDTQKVKIYAVVDDIVIAGR